MKKSRIGILIMICAVMFSNSIVSFAKGNTLSFGDPYMESESEKDYGNSVSATIVSKDFPAPRINSDGSFTVNIKDIGYVLTSDKFKVSDTYCKITMDAGPGSASGSEYYVTLYKDGIIDTKVQKITYYTGGVYEYTFTGLSTSSKYYMKIDSNNTTLDCYGTISNYVAIN